MGELSAGAVFVVLALPFGRDTPKLGDTRDARYTHAHTHTYSHEHTRRQTQTAKAWSCCVCESEGARLPGRVR